jgi:hypothetical protein
VESELEEQTEEPLQPVRETYVSRRSGRSVRSPVWHKDYQVNSSSCLYPIANHICYNNLSPVFQDYVFLVSKVIEPSRFSEAREDKNWVEAMRLEILALEENHTWDVVQLPSSKKPIGCRWVYKVKLNQMGQ